MDPDSDFQKKMVEYLESVHQGEFLTGDIKSVRAEIEQAEMSDLYKNPTKTLPEQPPPVCKRKKCDGCFMCLLVGVWWHKFRYTVDDLLLRSNIHECGDNCYSNGHESCKSCFPCELFDKTVVDPDTSALNMKKGEAQMNTFTPLLTYLLRCNTDVTSLLSGTAVKAVVAYVTEYVTKPGLKTYSIFDTIHSVFDRNSELIGESQKKVKRPGAY
jgi:ferredoxin